MLMPITLTFAAATTLLNLWLSFRVGRLRVSHGVAHGDGGEVMLLRRMRAQSNYIEYTPFALILCGLVEMAFGSALWLWIVALLYVVARVLHAFGMDSEKPGKLRMIGISATFLILLGLSLTALYAAYATTRELPAPPSMAVV